MLDAHEEDEEDDDVGLPDDIDEEYKSYEICGMSRQVSVDSQLLTQEDIVFLQE